MTHSQAERLIAALERIADLMDPRPQEVKDREREDREFAATQARLQHERSVWEDAQRQFRPTYTNAVGGPQTGRGVRP